MGQVEGNHDEGHLQHEHRGKIQGKNISKEYGHGIAVILIMEMIKETSATTKFYI